MRRAALQSLRTARQPCGFKVFHRGPVTGSPCYGFGLRTASTSSSWDHRVRPVLNSSMQFRGLYIAVASALAGSGAWYAYRGTDSSSGSAGESTGGGSIGRSSARASSGAYSDSPQAANGGVGLVNQGETRRQALVVDNDQLYTELISGDEPLQKTTDDAGRKLLMMMTPDQATEKLRRNEESYLVGRGRGLVRYDIVQLSSNDPIEDDHAEKIVDVPDTIAAAGNGSASSDWMFWGVFDGHSGWTTSAKLRQVLISFVARELTATYKSALADPSVTQPTPESIDAAIRKGFVRLDHEIIHESVEKVMKANSKRAAAELLAPALSGSCALLSFYDSQTKTLRVACTGDSRAVLGRRGPSGKWTATALSVDQTGSNEEEAARLRREHPGEDYVVRNGRVLGGLEPTRAFGDSIYKWSREVQDRIKGSFFGRTPSQLLRSPPYVTAEPVVTATKIDSSKGDFVVMATDGLWEMLTNEEVVGLVGKWIEAQGDASHGASGKSKSWLQTLFKNKPEEVLPVEKEAQAVDGKGRATNGQKTPIRQRQWGVNTDQNSRFVVEDKNVATHLVRNALGGKDRDMVCALLTLPSPYSRKYRDDLTVQVIFFGEGDRSGNVTLNAEASAQTEQLKAKL
ncbi:MAG: hypothetical protein M1815_003960 [Lichina confinis]|nr:MAG: hypothetical protein M1815_003960 [Lichina confinis]